MILMSYGGIYLDNSVLVVNSLDKYRKFEMTLSWEVNGQSLATNVMIANPYARFLYG